MLSSRLYAFFLSRGRGLRFAKGPAINLHVDSHANFYALSFKQLSLQCGVWLRYANPAASPEHAMPRNSFAAWAGRQSVTDSARSSPQSHRFRDPTIGCYVPPRNFFHLTIDWVPGHFASFVRANGRRIHSIKIVRQRSSRFRESSYQGKAGRKPLLLKFCGAKCCAKNAALSD
jgi:hypothetical protein